MNLNMTGKDAILLILKYDLLNERIEVSVDDKGMFLTAQQAAVKLGISTVSLLDMAKIGLVDSIEIEGEKYFWKGIDLSSIGKERL